MDGRLSGADGEDDVSHGDGGHLVQGAQLVEDPALLADGLPVPGGDAAAGVGEILGGAVGVGDHHGQGLKVAVPRVKGREMAFYYIDCFEDLEPGCFGIPEPKKSCMTAEETDAPVIVPGVAFSERFERTGYGAGYYDRFFEKEPQHRKIAICYDFQIAEAIAVDQYDVLMDQIITPGRELSRL